MRIAFDEGSGGSNPPPTSSIRPGHPRRPPPSEGALWRCPRAETRSCLFSKTGNSCRVRSPRGVGRRPHTMICSKSRGVAGSLRRNPVSYTPANEETRLWRIASITPRSDSSSIPLRRHLTAFIFQSPKTIDIHILSIFYLILHKNLPNVSVHQGRPTYI